MNAKQIADELENIYWIQGDGKGKPFQQYADFVRQQQAEIEALKAKTLTPLTDEEIEIECRKAWNLNDQYRLNLEEVIRFAHAILRKAQEK